MKDLGLFSQSRELILKSLEDIFYGFDEEEPCNKNKSI